MKRIFNKHTVLVFALLLLTIINNSCVKDDEISITEPTRYTSEDITSYADLFKVFWTTMDQRYNYFYEQKINADKMDWDAIYKEYYPKFAALKSYNRDGFTNEQVEIDVNLAARYFTDIIDPIIDRHFYFGYSLPFQLLNGTYPTFGFAGGLKKADGFSYDWNNKFNYIKDLIGNDYIEGLYKDEEIGLDFRYQMGSLKTNPDIYYVTYNQFALLKGLAINFSSNKYLDIDSGSGQSLLTATEIENSSQLAAISDDKLRKELKDLTLKIFNAYDSFLHSNKAEISVFNENVSKFKNTEIVTTTFVTTAEELHKKITLLPDYADKNEYSTVTQKESEPYINWFKQRMAFYANAYKFKTFSKEANELIKRAPVYQNFFNPLHQGKIKKIIIDLRGNGGGMAIDVSYFVNRLVTKNAVWAYQRTKEGNGRFNYTPWVPTMVNPHQFNIPANIPIVSLTDKNSISMAEVSTLIWKTQGAISIGDYSKGGTAGLVDNADQFNGGSQDNIGLIDKDSNGKPIYKLSFYMPIMATKDANGNVIEGIGIKPDIYVAPPSEEEVNEMKNSPKTHIDRTLSEAIKYLSSK